MDEIDGLLLAALRVDGRARHRELGLAAGISRAAAGARLQRLIGDRVLHVVGAVHPYVLGLQSLAHLAVELDGPARATADRIAALDEAPFVSMTSGPSSLVAELRVRSPEALAATISRVRQLDGVRAVSSNNYTSLTVDVLRPSGLPTSTIDRTDITLLALLQDDGRLPYSELGARTGLSASAARMRVRHLIDGNVVRVGPLLGARAGEREFRLGVGVQFRGEGTATMAALRSQPAMRFLAATTGRFDAIGTLHGASTPELVSALDAMRRMTGVTSVDSWMHLELVKESYRFDLSHALADGALDGVRADARADARPQSAPPS